MSQIVNFLGIKLENLIRFSFCSTRNIVFGTLKIGLNDPQIPNLEFKNQVFLPTKQAGTNIGKMIYKHINYKICPSLFSWQENILPKQHIVHCQ